MRASGAKTSSGRMPAVLPARRCCWLCGNSCGRRRCWSADRGSGRTTLPRLTSADRGGPAIHAGDGLRSWRRRSWVIFVDAARPMSLGAIRVIPVAAREGSPETPSAGSAAAGWPMASRCAGTHRRGRCADHWRGALSATERKSPGRCARRCRAALRLPDQPGHGVFRKGIIRDRITPARWTGAFVSFPGAGPGAASGPAAAGG